MCGPVKDRGDAQVAKGAGLYLTPADVKARF